MINYDEYNWPEEVKEFYRYLDQNLEIQVKAEKDRLDWFIQNLEDHDGKCCVPFLNPVQYFPIKWKDKK